MGAPTSNSVEANSKHKVVVVVDFRGSGCVAGASRSLGNPSLDSDLAQFDGDPRGAWLSVSDGQSLALPTLHLPARSQSQLQLHQKLKWGVLCVCVCACWICKPLSITNNCNPINIILEKYRYHLPSYNHKRVISLPYIYGNYIYIISLILAE